MENLIKKIIFLSILAAGLAVSTSVAYALPTDGLGNIIPDMTGGNNTGTNNSQSASTTARNDKDQQQYETEKQKLEDVRSQEEQNAQKECQDALDAYQAKDDSSVFDVEQYVPVHETGELLTLTKSVDTNTGQNTKLSLQLCLYLREIRRTIYSLENKAFITDPQLAREAATDVEIYKNSLFDTQHGLVKTGYNPPGDVQESGGLEAANAGGAPLYVTNLNAQLSAAQDEASGVFQNDFKQVGNSFEQQTLRSLDMYNNASPISSYGSALSSDEYNQFVNGGLTLSGDDWWDTFSQIFDVERASNPSLTVIKASEEDSLRRQQAAEQASQEIIAGQGYLPVRHCVEMTQDNKYCRSWVIDSPASAVAQTVGNSLAARQNMYTNPQAGQIAPGNEPTAAEVQTLQTGGGTSNGGGGASGINTSDMLNNNGSGNGNSGLDDINYHGSTNPGGNIGGGGSTGGGTNPTPTPNQAPIVNIIAQKGASNLVTVRWATQNIMPGSCFAYNQWLSASSTKKNQVWTIKKDSESLPDNGSLTFRRPLAFNVSIVKDRGAYSGNRSEERISTTTNQNGNSWEATWIPNGKGINKNDIYTMKFTDANYPQGYEVVIDGEHGADIKPEDVSGVLARMASAINGDANLWYYRAQTSLDRLKVYADSGTTDSTALVYSILCQGLDGGVKQSTAKLK